MIASLTQTRLVDGVWEGQLSGVTGPLPTLEAWHHSTPLGGVQVHPLPGSADRYVVRVTLPPAILSEGVQTILFRVGEEVMAQLTVIAGVPIEEDLRAEISLLRAELDLLKRAFRRHCSETAV